MPIHPSAATLRVVVLSGGDSDEREVSLRSGAAVERALCAAGHQVEKVDPQFQPLDTIDWSGVDACFIALHGGAGEDGRIQQQLTTLGVPFTGSNAPASRLAMSKSASKERFVAAGVPTLPWTLVHPSDSPTSAATRVGALGLPLILKPESSGSSIGLLVVETAETLPDSVRQCQSTGVAYLAEPLVRGREFTVALLESRVLPTMEIVAPQGLFSYEAKYQSVTTEYWFDFELPPAKRGEIERAAVGAAQALGTAGLVRVDIMLDGEQSVWVLEVNTIPGMTERSLAPQAAARAGLDMRALCDGLVRQALNTAEGS